MQVPSNTANQFGITGLFLNPLLFGGINPEVSALLNATGKLLQAAGDFTAEFAALNDKLATTGAAQPAPVQAPNVEESFQPSGGLQTNGNVVTTPGGYKIEMLNQYEWKITGPDGATTRIWGDPHVDEGDRDGASDWDFKRNTTFVLGDGTELHVKTVPGGAPGMTVTGQIDIISGKDFVQIKDIDKGKGVIGDVTQTGRQHTNDYGGYDVVEQGAQADDWSFRGKEIVGSHDGGASFELGGDIAGVVSDIKTRFSDADRWALTLFTGILNRWSDNSSRGFGINPYSGSRSELWAGTTPGKDNPKYDRERHRENMREALHLMADMFKALSRLFSLADQFNASRNRFQTCQA